MSDDETMLNCEQLAGECSELVVDSVSSSIANSADDAVIGIDCVHVGTARPCLIAVWIGQQCWEGVHQHFAFESLNGRVFVARPGSLLIS